MRSHQHDRKIVLVSLLHASNWPEEMKNFQFSSSVRQICLSFAFTLSFCCSAHHTQPPSAHINSRDVHKASPAHTRSSQMALTLQHALLHGSIPAPILRPVSSFVVFLIHTCTHFMAKVPAVFPLPLVDVS